MRLAGRTVLLTGATGGIGQAVARRLHAAGARLVLTGRRVDVLEPLAAELGGARALAVDLGDRAEVGRLADACADVDVLIANAALPGSGALLGFTEEQIDRALEVNLRAPMILARRLAGPMASRGSGHILLMSSLAGKTGHARVERLCRHEVRPARVRAGPARRPARGGVGVSVVFPASSPRPGCCTSRGPCCPRGVGMVTPRAVADAVVRAIERNRGEVDVAPASLRAGAKIAGLAPELSATVARWLGSEAIAGQFERGQRVKR
jgi:NAD(P)-dependent dehydrogenase (short-subunit alcohol dehydrogenase family)